MVTVCFLAEASIIRDFFRGNPRGILTWETYRVSNSAINKVIAIIFYHSAFFYYYTKNAFPCVQTTLNKTLAPTQRGMENINKLPP